MSKYLRLGRIVAFVQGSWKMDCGVPLPKKDIRPGICTSGVFLKGLEFGTVAKH